MIGSLIKSIIPPQYRILIVLIFGASLFGGGVIFGAKYEQGRQALETIEQIEAVAKLNKKARTNVAKAADEGAKKEQETKIVYRTITKEVVKYAQTDNGNTTCVNADFVRNHDIAAVPDISKAGSETAPNAYQPTNAETLGIVAQNYETCNQWRSQLIEWQNWYRASGLDK